MADPRRSSKRFGLFGRRKSKASATGLSGVKDSSSQASFSSQSMLSDPSVGSDTYNVKSPKESGSLRARASKLHNQGKFEQAEDLYRQDLTAKRDAFGNFHADVATCLQHLASCLKDQQKFEEAEVLFRQALDIRKQVLGVDHPAVAGSLHGLASLLVDLGKYEKSEEIFREALEIHNSKPGQAESATSLENLAFVLGLQGKLLEAGDLYRAAMKLRRERYGHDSVEVANTMCKLGKVLQDLAEFDEAENLFRQAIERLKSKLGENHSDVATAMNSLARVLEYRGKFDDAERMYCDAIDTFKRTLGEEHTEVAASTNQLAGLVRVIGVGMDLADSLAGQSLRIRERAFGTRHLETADSYAEIAMIRVLQNNFEEGKSYAERALGIIQEKSRNPSEKLKALRPLGLSLAHEGNLVDAEDLFRDALKIRETLQSLNHPDRAMALHDLAMVLELSSPEQATELGRQAYDIALNWFGEDHPTTVGYRKWHPEEGPEQEETSTTTTTRTTRTIQGNVMKITKFITTTTTTIVTRSETTTMQVPPGSVKKKKNTKQGRQFRASTSRSRSSSTSKSETSGSVIPHRAPREATPQRIAAVPESPVSIAQPVDQSDYL